MSHKGSITLNSTICVAQQWNDSNVICCSVGHRHFFLQYLINKKQCLQKEGSHWDILRKVLKENVKQISIAVIQNRSRRCAAKMDDIDESFASNFVLLCIGEPTLRDQIHVYTKKCTNIILIHSFF